MAKTKISVTVDSGLVRRIDELAVDASRSEIVEIALARWLRDRKAESLEHATEAYYRELTNEDEKEDAEWAAHSAGAVHETWK